MRSDNLRPAQLGLSSDEIGELLDEMKGARVRRIFRGPNWPDRSFRTLAEPGPEEADG